MIFNKKFPYIKLNINNIIVLKHEIRKIYILFFFLKKVN